MAQTVSIDAKIAKDIVSSLRELKQQLASLNEKLENAPPYGSDEWWKWSNRKALQSIKRGQGITVRNKKELDEFFNTL